MVINHHMRYILMRMITIVKYIVFLTELIVHSKIKSVGPGPSLKFLHAGPPDRQVVDNKFYPMLHVFMCFLACNAVTTVPFHSRQFEKYDR